MSRLAPEAVRNVREIATIRTCIMSSREITKLLIFGVVILVLALLAHHFGWL